MAIQVGTRLGPYEVTAQIGAGGMGVVYRAHDTTLDRDVAIKVLPDAFANDPERLARFEREAKVLASLNHPNIAAIYGLEKSGETPALILELVEGPTLADLIAPSPGLQLSSPPAGERTTGKPLPLEEALPVARQIAEALEAAHEQGIIHRDLKPANVKVKSDGTVKVLDFGLAKALQPELSDLDAANSPTMTMTAAATKMGVIMGTAAYMSPEQARGKTVDRRADIWAFGVVLYEMLTGAAPFRGEDITLTLAEVVRAEPNWQALPADLSPVLDSYLRRCLDKDPTQRVQAIGDVRLAMQGAFESAGSVTGGATEPIAQPALWQRPAAIAAMVLGAIVVGALTVWTLTPPAAIPIVRMPIPLGADENFDRMGRHAVAISPDGSQIVYVANGGLRLRPVDQLQATPIAGTQGGTATGGREPFFSPDGQWIAFEADNQLKKVALSGGAPITLGALDGGLVGASWGTDDTILYGQGADGIWQVPGTGGTPEQLITVEDGEWAHGPQMLPGGEAVLYTVAAGPGAWDTAQIVVEQVATSERTVLIDRGRDGRYLPTGHLVYVLNSVLFAVPFDPGARAVTGGPVSLVEGIRVAAAQTGAAHFSVADTGALVYIPGGGDSRGELVWVDRTRQTEPVGAEPGAYRIVRISPDGSRVAVDTVGAGNGDVWIYHLARDTLTRLTFDEAVDDSPLWTPDSSRVVFRSEREGGGLFWKAADGTGEVERLLDQAGAQPHSWSTDGRLVFDLPSGDIGVVAVEGDRTMELVLDTDFQENDPEISPDGRWIAYHSDESGQTEVYVRPFPNVDDGKWQVSASGGREPLWSPDGRELFFINGTQFLVARVETAPTFNATTPEVVFARGDFTAGPGREHDISPDGEQFLFVRQLSFQVGEDAGLVFVQNWTQELKARVPVP